MIYTASFELKGVLGPGGFASRDRDEVLSVAHAWAEQALLTLGDAASSAEWFDLNGEPTELGVLFHESEAENRISFLSQVHDLLSSKGEGHLSLSEHECIHELVADQYVLEWCSSSVEAQIRNWRLVEDELIAALNNDWAVA